MMDTSISQVFWKKKQMKQILNSREKILKHIFEGDIIILNGMIIGTIF